MTKTKLTLLIALKSFVVSIIAMAISLYISLTSLPFPSIFDPDKNPNPPILWARLFLCWMITCGVIGLGILLVNKFISKPTTETKDSNSVKIEPLLSTWVIVLIALLPGVLITLRITNIFSPSLRSHTNYHMTEALNFDDPLTLAWLMTIADIRDGKPLVNMAIQGNSANCLRLLNYLAIRPERNVLPKLMIQGASTGNNNLIQLTMDYGVSVNLQTAYGQTPLIAATEQEKTETVEFLLKAGADVNLAPANSFSPLIAALLNDNNKILKVIIQSGANIKACKMQKEFSLARKTPDEKGETPALLLPADSTPLMLAAASGNSEAVKMLLAAGLSATENNSINYTALAYAKASACAECEKALLEAGAK